MIVKKSDALDISELLKELFKTEGFEFSEYEGWIVPEGRDYAMKGYWYPNATETTGQLTIEVFINSEMVIVESFSGLGTSGREKLKNAFSSLVHHDFSAMLFALWNKDTQLKEEIIWEIGEKRYEVYLGNQGIVNYDKEKRLEVPQSYAEQIKQVICSEPFLTKEFHWFTFFYANLNGLDSSAEVLKDNIRWIRGENRLKSLAWRRSNHYYTVRQFIIIREI